MAGISHQNGLKLLKSENFSDFTITCPGKVFKVHKAIISAESSYLAVCCGEKFKEGQENNINLPNNPGLVWLMLEHLYSGEYKVRTYAETYPDKWNKMSADAESLDSEVRDATETLGQTTDADRREPEVSDEGSHASSDDSLSSIDAADMVIPPKPYPGEITDYPGYAQREAQYIARVHMNVYALADFLDMDTLKTYATNKIITSIQQSLKDDRTIVIADQILIEAPYNEDPELKDVFVKTCLDWYVDHYLLPSLKFTFKTEEPYALHYAKLLKKQKRST